MIIRSKRSAAYTIVPNATFEDGRLSFAARGLLAYLLVKPDDWTVNVMNLQRTGAAGRDRVYGLLRELVDAGYVIRTQINTAQGASPVNYTVYDSPQEAQAPGQIPGGRRPGRPKAGTPFTETPFPGKADTGSPLPESPFTGNPFTGNPDALTSNQKAPINQKAPRDANASRRTRRAEPSASPVVDSWAPLKDGVLESFGVPGTASNYKQAQKAVGAAQANGLDGARGARAWAAFVAEQKAGGGWEFARLHSVGALFGKWVADTLERRGLKAARSEDIGPDPAGAPAGWRRAVYFDHDGALKIRDPQLVLPRFGVDRNAPVAAWPTWLQEVYRGTVYS